MQFTGFNTMRGVKMSHYTPALGMLRPTTRVVRVPQLTQRSQLSQSGRRFVRSATVVAILTIGAFAFINGAGSSMATATSESSSVEFTYVTISAGQNLWSLAEELAPGQDPRDWIVEVVNLNGLTSAEVQPGQKIALPN